MLSVVIVRLDLDRIHLDRRSLGGLLISSSIVLRNLSAILGLEGNGLRRDHR